MTKEEIKELADAPILDQLKAVIMSMMFDPRYDDDPTDSEICDKLIEYLQGLKKCSDIDS